MSPLQLLHQHRLRHAHSLLLPPHESHHWQFQKRAAGDVTPDACVTRDVFLCSLFPVLLVLLFIARAFSRSAERHRPHVLRHQHLSPQQSWTGRGHGRIHRL